MARTIKGAETVTGDLEFRTVKEFVQVRWI